MNSRFLFVFLSFLIFINSLFAYKIQKRDYENRQYFTLHTIRPNDIKTAKQVASQLNATFEGQVGELSHYYWISIPASIDTHQDLVNRFVNLQKKRNHPSWLVDQIEPQIPKRRLFKRAPPPPLPVIENEEEEYKLNGGNFTVPSLDDINGFEKMKELFQIKDPGFDRQWHLINTQERGHDLNVTGVWSQGITGKEVVVAILDDGLDMNHEDLKDNYFAEGSYDFNDHVPDPKPRLVDDTHGTRCAGEIAAVKNNVCGIGVAYEAKVSGIRILSGEITEADEATALNYEYQRNHIYSCSWGPSDLGEVAEAPRGIVLDAIKNGIQNGRNGSGSIYVFASGNGGVHEDNCNFDGYTNSLYTITVGAIDRMGNHPYYSEKCAAQLVVTYSSGSGGYIYTTDIGENKCSDRHGGTSAAAPLAAGVFALVLSVRPDLTWRDMQHLCIQSAIPISLDDDDWTRLPSGRMFNHKYGYGVLDAYRIVELAKTFKSVQPQTKVEVKSPSSTSKQDIPDLTPSRDNKIDKHNAFTSTLMVTQDRLDKAGLLRLEHVTVTVNIEHQQRGDLEILLESPHGISSQLASPRPRDKSSDGLIDWTFMTVKHWEEDPVGNWTLRIVDGKNPNSRGQFINWKLTLWGEVMEGFQFDETDHYSHNDDEPIMDSSSGIDDVDSKISPSLIIITRMSQQINQF
ncbi:peptidase S8/S53 domain-containing protein [Cokeromyces recurvatus]|uniref:peptidase S8/S53 domain-containing protein n=1 Tax=Cokeromyces recurvatus TaxID=90255 RepID=UPI00222032CD|nr:peptidase S8/S53 domain-containing protein [Cokeromyces recurvatus]KAI7898804.1 peptidase S8/S53 domain-containing protein [Cokeromyces recurvatus]